MEHEIIDKLNRHIAKGFHDDPDVVYLLVQFGKLMESTACEEDYSVLKFYRDWVVHARITRSEVGGTVLQHVADIIFELREADTATLLRALTDALSLETARQQLVALAARFGVNQTSFGEREWQKVVPVLMEIISNIPLSIDPERSSKKLKAILENIKAKPLNLDKFGVVWPPGPGPDTSKISTLKFANVFDGVHRAVLDESSSRVRFNSGAYT